jgi:hypothetical protein
MLAAYVFRLALLILLSLSIAPLDLALAQSLNSTGQRIIPATERTDSESGSSEFLSRLKDYRSVALRKESVSKEYARLEMILNASLRVKEKVDGELAAINSRYGSAQELPDQIVDRISLLAPKSENLSNQVNSRTLQLELLVEEYDVLSRMEEAEKKYRAKAISKPDYVSEKRQLMQELSQLRIARQVEDLGLRLADELHYIRSELTSLKHSR